MSKFRQHQNRVWQQEQQAAETEQKTEGKTTVIALPANSGNDYQVMWGAVKQDIQRLKELPKHDDRDRLKRDELLPKYRDYVDTWLDSADDTQNDVIAYYLIWLSDAGDLSEAILLADECANRGIKMQMMNRDAVHFVTDEAFRVAEDIYKEGGAEATEFIEVFERMADQKWSINRSLAARLYKLAGLYRMDTDPKTALDYFVKANDFKGDIGVKTRIKDLQKQLEKA